MDLLTLLKEIRFGSWDVNYIESEGCSCGNGSGWGDGLDSGYSFGKGYGRGCGFSYGWGNGLGNGWGNGNGNGDGDSGGHSCCGISRGITEVNGMEVYIIDRVPTAIETVFSAYAKGYIIGNGTTLTPCYVVFDGGSAAHGKTLKEAFRDVRAKEMEKLPEDERVNRFVTEHPDPSETLPNKELFYMHHVLTGSCEFGRKEFCKANGIDLASLMCISKFLALTENEYGGNVIKKIKEEYLRRGCDTETCTFAS